MSAFSYTKKKLLGAFGVVTKESGIPETPFTDYLLGKTRYNKLDEKTVRNVLDVFGKLGLPPPEQKDEFIAGTEGQLVFMSRYGLVLRVEDKRHLGESGGAQAKGAPWVLQPLASFDVGEAIVTICPGCRVGGTYEQNAFLQERLNKQGVSFWDSQTVNFGRMPVNMPQFPDGIPIVIDRGAVENLSRGNVVRIKTALGLKKQDQLARDAAKAEEELYGPLRHAFNDAWPDKAGPADAAKMRQFLDLCADYKRAGKLVAGWDTPDAEGKTALAGKVAGFYEQLLRAAEKRAALQQRPEPARTAPVAP